MNSRKTGWPTAEDQDLPANGSPAEPQRFSPSFTGFWLRLFFLDVMTDNRDSVSVPSWDGAARGWRRYTREVSWWVQATPIGKRRYCASKLISKLTGPARLLAMSWSVSKGTFDDPDGTRLLLQRLSASPLVRKTLPNAAAICQQYFSFKRSPQESIGNFLVRETLVHEEFVEAIIRLHEEKLGIAQDQRDFGLPDPVEEEVWAPWRDWMPEDEDTVTGETAEGDAAPTMEATSPTTAGAPAARAPPGLHPVTAEMDQLRWSRTRSPS